MKYLVTTIHTVAGGPFQHEVDLDLALRMLVEAGLTVENVTGEGVAEALNDAMSKIGMKFERYQVGPYLFNAENVVALHYSIREA